MIRSTTEPDPYLRRLFSDDRVEVDKVANVIRVRLAQAGRIYEILEQDYLRYEQGHPPAKPYEIFKAIIASETRVPQVGQ